MSINKNKKSLHLRGNAVELRTFAEENLTESYIGWLCDPNLMRFSNQRFCTHSMESCRLYMSEFASTDDLFMAIYHKSSFIGTMTAYRSLVHGTADMGLLVSPNAQGKGLGKDAWITLMTYLLTSGTRKVTGGTLRCNLAMVRIMEGSGMRPDGVRIGQEIICGEAHDILHYAKFAQAGQM